MEQPCLVSEIPQPIQQEDIGLLDILVTLAENIKLLIFVPMLVGLCALGLAFIVPKTFESIAVLKAEQGTASLMTTAAVLDPVAAGLGLTTEESGEEARRLLREQIKVAVGRNDKLLTLTVSAPAPQQAQAIAEAVLQQTYVQSRPKASELARLEAQLKDAQVRIKNAEDAAGALLKRMESSGAGSSTESARGYAELLSVTAAAQNQVATLQTQLEGVTDAQLIQAPTLPQRASKPKKALLAIGATLATGLALLLFVFVRQAARSTVKDADAAGKVARIRRALGLR
ncbi:Wzz/FepE/Etk N-terminal domain-containing protein [Acidovorax sp. SRB_14]|uniref:Wzz/FepE/Etk N-terminal domain-containing protein n=1 Tax=Acidovorax sp. SRB_14 TaxID=1962699 RepID=UPI0015653EC5|nr:Wzz/FepE/Etk N-terminal domain-containing protein [Acidovorax sp. SRB_14]